MMLDLLRARLHLMGDSLGEDLSRLLVSVVVRERLGCPAQCEFVLADPGDAPHLHDIALGTPFSVGVGDLDGKLFAGRISALTWRATEARGPELTVRGYDTLQELRASRRSGSHTQVSASDLLNEWLAPHGVSVQDDADLPRSPLLLRQGEDDLSFVSSLAAAAGAWFILDHSQADPLVRVFGPDGFGTERVLVMGDALRQVEIERNTMSVATGVEVRGWDPSMAQDHAATHPIGTPSDTPSIDHAPWPLLNVSLRDSSEAERLARGLAAPGLNGSPTCRGVASGDASLHPGARVRLQSVPAGLEGPFVITQVEHRMDAGEGYITEFLAGAPPGAGPSPVLSATLGRVTHVDDPSRLGRVRVSLPAFGDGGGPETSWMQVVSPGAGERRGLVALPDIGDDVLVLLTDTRTAQGLVLGGLYGSRGLEDAQPRGDSSLALALRTAAGQRLVLDDHGPSLSLVGPGAGALRMTTDRVELSADGDLIIQAPGRRVLIRGARIDFERA